MQESGKYFLDISKLIFGGVILAGIMNLGVDSLYLFGIGESLVVIFAGIGFKFYSKSKQEYMDFIYFLIATGIVGLMFYVGMMWYDRKHNYDW